jgi:hypothetical protein
LKTACPKLEEFAVNMIYSDIDRIDRPAKQAYDTLFSAGVMPTWPITLRRLDMQHLRQADPDIAVRFFESIIGAASELTDLRHLILSCSVDLSWSERGNFRSKWTSLFEKVFKRKTINPVSYMQSFKSYRLHKERLEKEKSLKKRARTSSNENSADSSSAGRLRPRQRVNYNSDDNTAGLPLALRVTSTLGRGKQRAEPAEPERFIQGLCEEVKISMDNARPMHEFRESDFLDSEEDEDSDFDAS